MSVNLSTETLNAYLTSVNLPKDSMYIRCHFIYRNNEYLVSVYPQKETLNVYLVLDWKPPKQLKCVYTQPIPHTNKKLSSLIAL